MDLVIHNHHWGRFTDFVIAKRPLYDICWHGVSVSTTSSSFVMVNFDSWSESLAEFSIIVFLKRIIPCLKTHLLCSYSFFQFGYASAVGAGEWKPAWNFCTLDFCDVGRVARMEAEAIDIASEERRASERIRQIGSQKAQQLKDLGSRAQACTSIIIIITVNLYSAFL